MITAYSYVRFSSKPQERGDSLRRQTALARKYADEHGLHLIEASYQDLGISAFKGRNAVEGALGAFLQAVDYGQIKRGSYLLVESMDRISRQQLDEALELFLSIIRRGITIVTLQDAQVYSKEKIKEDKGLSLIVSIMVMSRAHEESATKAKRVKEAWQAKRDAGGILTSMGPAWLKHNKLTRQWEVIREKAEIVQRIFQMSAAGYGSPAIADKLNAEGVPTMATAKFWTASLIARLLENSAVHGEYTPKKADDKTPIPDYYPKIVERDLFYLVQERIKSRHRTGGPKGKSVSNLFSSRAWCECGEKMRYVSSNKKHRYLQCLRSYSNAGCDAPTMPYNAFETEVMAWIVGYGRITLDGPQHIDPRVALQGELERKQQEQANVLELHATSTKGSAPRLVMQRLEKLEEEISTLEREIASFVPVQPRGRSLKAAHGLWAQHQKLQGRESEELTELRMQLQAELRRLITKVVFRKATKQYGGDPRDNPDGNPLGEYREVVLYGPLAEEAILAVYGTLLDVPDDNDTTSDGGWVVGYWLPSWGINGTRTRA